MSGPTTTLPLWESYPTTIHFRLVLSLIVPDTTGFPFESIVSDEMFDESIVISEMFEPIGAGNSFGPQISSPVRPLYLTVLQDGGELTGSESGTRAPMTSTSPAGSRASALGA